MTVSRRIGVIIAAAGSGERLGEGPPKQWRKLAGKTLVERALASFSPGVLKASDQKSFVSHVALVVDDLRQTSDLPSFASMDIAIVVGRDTRTGSVQAGLTALPVELDFIAVHDAARPFWPLKLWDTLIETAAQADGAIPAAQISDTIKRREGNRTTTVDRRELWSAQTPQVFRAEILHRAHEHAKQNRLRGTDDAELVERIGGDIRIVQSTGSNWKITVAEDWELAERIAGLTGRTGETKVGIGFDAHRLGSDNPLVIGGVRLADSGGLIGHSDGDVLLHAICDALLGASTLGDIGRHFPPGDPEFAGIDSRKLVCRTRDLLDGVGYSTSHVDAVIMAESPRMAPHIEAMRTVIAADLQVDLSQVSIKATTTETMGFVGRKEGIAAQAVATVIKRGGE